MKSMQRLFLWLTMIFTIAFSAVVVVPAQTPHQDDAELMAAYNAAIVDASVYRFSNLRPLHPLAFEPVTNRANVVTITGWTGYRKGRTTLKQEVWVTPDTEVKSVCKNFTGDVALRLKQLLGLSPGTNITHAVRMSIRKADVFRPTFDPKTTTGFPCAHPTTSKCGLEFPAKISGYRKLHVRWIANQTFKSYVISESPLIPRGYPWTRLGYTYDWRPGSNKYGASEYVVRKGSRVTILEEPIQLEAYCKANQ